MSKLRDKLWQIRRLVAMYFSRCHMCGMPLYWGSFKTPYGIKDRFSQKVYFVHDYCHKAKGNYTYAIKDGRIILNHDYGR